MNANRVPVRVGEHKAPLALPLPLRVAACRQLVHETRGVLAGDGHVQVAVFAGLPRE
jgi:hypothetical protein